MKGEAARDYGVPVIKGRTNDAGLYSLGAALILIVVILAMAYILFLPSRRPELLPVLAGCYRGSGFLQPTQIIVDRDGILTSQGDSTKVVVSEDKGGFSLLPAKRVFLDGHRGTRLYMSPAPHSYLGSLRNWIASECLGELPI